MSNQVLRRLDPHPGRFTRYEVVIAPDGSATVTWPEGEDCDAAILTRGGDLERRLVDILTTLRTTDLR